MSDDVAALRASKFGQLTVRSVMEKEVQSGMKDSEAKLLASYMMEGFGSVPIIDETSKLVGIVSEFDLLKALRKGKNLEEVMAGDIMTANPISVTQDTNVLTLMDVLQNNHLIRVPVVDSKGKLIGIVARRDLLRCYLQTSLS
ncbi:CBS domain-containing protein [uncultured Nitrospira sp.]|uniref:CBS domain-containing protein n=1 Tax=uncultured Nitrospira sp. TaxID=157176 RepID=UPI00313FE7F7